MTLSLAVSLVVALTFTPMAAAFGRGRKATGSTGSLPVTGFAPADGTAAEVPAAGSGWFASWSFPADGRRRWLRWPQVAGLALVVGLPVLILRLVRLVLAGLHKLFVLALWPATRLFELVFPRLQDGYGRLLGTALRHRVTVLVLVTALESLSVAIQLAEADLVQ